MNTKNVTASPSKKEWELAFQAVEDLTFEEDADEAKEKFAEDIANALLLIRKQTNRRFANQLVDHYLGGILDRLEVGNTEGIGGRGFGDTDSDGDTTLDLAMIYEKIEELGDIKDQDQRHIFIAAILVHEFVHVAQSGSVTLSKEAKAWAVTQWFLRKSGGLDYLTDHISDVFREDGPFDTQTRAEYYINAAVLESLEAKIYYLDHPDSAGNKQYPSYSTTLRDLKEQREAVNLLYHFILDRRGSAFKDGEQPSTLEQIVSEIEQNALAIDQATVGEWGNVVSRSQVNTYLSEHKGELIIPRE